MLLTHFPPSFTSGRGGVLSGPPCTSRLAPSLMLCISYSQFTNVIEYIFRVTEPKIVIARVCPRVHPGTSRWTCGTATPTHLSRCLPPAAPVPLGEVLNHGVDLPQLHHASADFGADLGFVLPVARSRHFLQEPLPLLHLS